KIPPRIYITESTTPETMIRTWSKLPPTSVTCRRRLASTASTTAATTATPAATPAFSGVASDSLTAGTIVSAITNASSHRTVAVSLLIGERSSRRLPWLGAGQQQPRVSGRDHRADDQHNRAGRRQPKILLAGHQPGQRPGDGRRGVVGQADGAVDSIVQPLGDMHAVGAEYRLGELGELSGVHRARRRVPRRHHGRGDGLEL